MNDSLRISVVQANLIWENAKENRKQFDDKFDALSADIDMVILPEMFTTGFTMNASQVAESMDGETVEWLVSMAKKKNIAIVGSLVIVENGNYFNRLLFVHPSGKFECYDKRHTFSLAGEDKVYQAGKELLIVSFKGWKICPLICYDLRFPVWARNTQDYDLLIFVANWPKPRISAWDSLLKARAIENMSYCIGVNRVGTDALKNEYPGHSACYDVLGNMVFETPTNKEHQATMILEKHLIVQYREQLRFLEDRDTFSLEK
jgi:predicted amidohydrolase